MKTFLTIIVTLVTFIICFILVQKGIYFLTNDFESKDLGKIIKIILWLIGLPGIVTVSIWAAAVTYIKLEK